MTNHQVAYEFANFRLLPHEKQLVCDKRAIKLQPKVFDTLVMLVENHGRLVEKDNFLKGLWPDTFVEEATLAHCISELRRTLRQESDGEVFIETVAKRGYRFVAPVKLMAVGEPQPSKPTPVLAVLPFENFSPEPDREYLADGLTEEVIAALGQIDPARLSVIGRTTIMRYKRTKVTRGDRWRVEGGVPAGEFAAQRGRKDQGDLKTGESQRPGADMVGDI